MGKERDKKHIEVLDIINVVKKEYANIQIVEIDKNDIVFEESVKMNCFYCAKYNNNFKCPPNIPQINFVKMISEYEHVFIVYTKFKIDDVERTRRESSIYLHNAMIAMEKELWKHNNSTALSFIGGSCKLCANGCDDKKCRNPYLARTPVEALGINIIKTVRKYGIKVYFYNIKEMLRIGMLLC